MEVNVHQAKEQLSRSDEQALAGEDVVSAAPKLGTARGQFQLSEGWDSPLTDREIDELFG